LNRLSAKKAYLNHDRWKTERSKIVGFIALVHLTLTWKPNLKREMVECLRATKCECHEKKSWIACKEENKTNSIPDFAVIFEKKSFGTEGCRAQTIVLMIETKMEDLDYLKILMRGASEQQKLSGVFVEAGYHLSASPKRMIGFSADKRLISTSACLLWC